ncbi:MAG: pyridoxamine 5'-phosphate oxidase family protein [Actinomycetota bacterium]
MSRTTADLTEHELSFLADRHLGTLTTLRADGSPHVIAIAFVYDPADGLVRIITSDNTQKVRNVERDPRVAVSQVEGPRWLTLEGEGVVTRDPDRVSAAVAAFESRYRPARENPNRVAIEFEVTRVMGRA